MIHRGLNSTIETQVSHMTTSFAMLATACASLALQEVVLHGTRHFQNSRPPGPSCPVSIGAYRMEWHGFAGRAFGRRQGSGEANLQGLGIVDAAPGVGQHVGVLGQAVLPAPYGI
jgi:hypothetical protein